MCLGSLVISFYISTKKSISHSNEKFETIARLKLAILSVARIVALSIVLNKFMTVLQQQTRNEDTWSDFQSLLSVTSSSEHQYYGWIIKYSDECAAVFNILGVSEHFTPDVRTKMGFRRVRNYIINFHSSGSANFLYLSVLFRRV